LFGEVDKIYAKTKKASGALLAPVSYQKAVAAYQKADKRFKKNQSVKKIEKDITVALGHFNKAEETIKLAGITFDSALKARTDAKSVGAKKLAPEEWLSAEEAFYSAAVSLETGKLSTARKKIAGAEEIYRSAELISIKTNYLSQTRKFIAKAKDEKVDRHAPDTLKEAEALLAKAEKELTNNRYDADYPRSLAKQSLYQAKHSIYLANYIKDLKKQKVSTEQLLLRMEKPIISISDSLDLVAEFDKGFEAPTQNINKEINRLVVDSREYIELRAQLEKLEIDYDGLEKQREKLTQINSLFRPEEAVVFTQGDNIIIRAVGLNFDPGSSEVNARHIPLLDKFKKAFQIFKGYSVTVEGHTDSFGSDAANLTLSNDRAMAVRNYFTISVPGFNQAGSSVRGYGETKPIANNETPAGRAKNRRIDLVFTPSR